MPGPSISSRPTQILSIQYLRAIAALMVVWHHAAGQVSGMSAQVPYMFGTSGVDLFFVISGFIMVVTTSGSSTRPVDFWRRRIVRVVPLYWLLTLAMVAVALVAPGLFKTLRVEPGALIRSLLFIPHFSSSFPDRVWPLLVPGWTLNFEMFFYAVFGASLFLAVRRRLVVLTGLLGLLVIAGMAFGPFASAAAQTYTHPMLLEFIAGAWIGMAWKGSKVRLPLTVSVLMLLTGGVLLVLRDAPPFGPFTQLLGSAMVVVAVLHPAFNTSRSAAFAAIGDSSYSLYLTHVFTLGILRILWVRLGLTGGHSAIEFMVLSLLTCTGVGWAVFRCIEMPLLQRLSRIGRRPGIASQPINQAQPVG